MMRIVRELRDRKMGVIYITHRLEELRAIGDRVTVLRDGNTVYRGDMAKISTEMITHMVGRKLLRGLPSRERQTPGPPCWKCGI